MTFKLKKIGQTVLFYGVLILAITIGQRIDPGGPCEPGLGMMLTFLFFPICIILFVWNFYQSIIKKRKDYLPSFIIHGLVIITFCVGVAIS
ncbi:hypothetical protein D3H65_12760 [Paraflavitalea soli]|uniref:Uncharacterized protein n=1 Tax=Paraflavitalea soli TaxID=2315862 RepID=A0A3B7MKU3_9BACT|nr:hypothetical protein D3H65_12760 [Paraflavitalea soli]